MDKNIIGSKQLIIVKSNQFWTHIATRSIYIGMVGIILWSLLPAIACGQAWFDPAWSYRRPVTISNTTQATLSGYQTQIKLGPSFDFAHAKTDGSDVRITTADGVTLVPFWVETWDAATQQATVWVKNTQLPVGQTTLYLYWGNPGAGTTTTPLPPTGPFTRAAGNPIVPIGDPGRGIGLLAENIAYDSATGHYWMAVYRPNSIGLLWSDSPANPSSWHWYGNVFNSTESGSYAPFLIKYHGMWYIFFSDFSQPAPVNISAITASSVTGPYSAPIVVLEPTPGSWEHCRVDEPFVFQRADGKWIMMYMADSTGGQDTGSVCNGAPTEQVGYAYADSILGPYTKYEGNPVIPFGAAGTYDAGTVADPWVYEFQGTYYIGYAASSTSEPPWQTAYATTTDWETFTKHGILLPTASSGWDSATSFRGGLIRVGDTYILNYTGDWFQIGIATQPAVSTALFGNPSMIFDFYDDFSGTGLDATKWSIWDGSAGQATVWGGLLTLNATSSSYVRIASKQTFGMDYMVEARGRHPQQGVLNNVVEVGMIDAGFGNTVRLVDDFHPSLPTATTTWNRQAKLNGQADTHWHAMAQTADTDWHIFGVGRVSPNIAGFRIDANSPETVTFNVPTSSMPAFLMSYTEGAANQFVVDWIRVRKTAYPEPVVSIDSEATIVLTPASLSFSATQGGSNPALKTIAISNGGGGTLNWTATADQTSPAWLSVNPASGTGAGTITASANISGLAAGTYTKAITIAATGAANTPQTVTVTLTITASSSPTIVLSPATLSFSATQGGSNPALKTIAISNGGGGTLNWTATADQTSPAWLSVNPASGTGAGTITASANISGLAAGTYTKAITIAATGAANTPQTVTVTLTITASSSPTIVLSPSSLSFSATQGGANPASKTIAISNGGGGTLNWTATANQTSPAWLSVSPASGTGAGTITASANISGLAAGTYTKAITIAATGAANTPQTVTVTLTITASSVTLVSLSLNPTAVMGGSSSQGTVTLSGPAPGGGVVVSLTSSLSPYWPDSVPASVTVPAGAGSATFTIITYPPYYSTSDVITASYNGVNIDKTLYVVK